MQSGQERDGNEPNDGSRKFRAHLRFDPAIWLALAFGGIYFFLGWARYERGLFYCFNAYFNTDTVRVIVDATSLEASNARTVTHPLFPLLVAPVGYVLSLLFERGAAVLLLVAVTAAFTLYFLVRALRTFVEPRESLALAFFYACTSSSLIMFSTTETFVWSALGIALLTFGVRAKKGRVWRGGASVLLLGVLTTNILHIVSAHFLDPAPSPLRKRALLGARWAGFAVIAVSLGAILQHYVIAGAPLFFAPNHLAAERRYVPTLTLSTRLLREVDLLAHFFQFSLVAPEPIFIRRNDSQVDWVTFLSIYDGVFARYPLAAWPALLLTSALLIWASYVNLRYGRRSVEVLTVLATLLLHLGLFSAYGDDFMLYSPLWMVHWMFWIALALRTSRQRRLRRPGALPIGLLGCMLFVSNVDVLSDVASHYDGAIPCRGSNRRCIERFYKPKAMHNKALGPRYRRVQDRPTKADRR